MLRPIGKPPNSVFVFRGLYIHELSMRPFVRPRLQRLFYAKPQMNYSELVMTKSIRERLLASPMYHRLPDRSLIFKRTLFRPQKGEARLFSSYKQLKNKFKDIEAAKRRRAFTKWWAVASVPLVFFGVFARAKYRQNQEALGDQEEVHPTSWKIFFYQALPLNAISRLWGKINRIELPVWAREPGFKLYLYLFGVNLEEVEEPDLTKYRNLSEFFYRSLKQGAREISDTLVVSPSDGKVLSLGMINENGEIEQVKGMSYSVNKFLGVMDSSRTIKLKQVELDYSSAHEQFAEINGISYTVDDLLGVNQDKDVHHFLRHININHGEQAISKTSSKLEQGSFREKVETKKEGPKKLFYSVIYLAPGDYHRFHLPTNWVVQVRKYFTGELYSVAPYFQKTFANLFILNERVSLLGYWKYGFFSMTPVGATNVGSIKINFDKELVTNLKLDPFNNNERFDRNTCYEATYFNSSPKLGGVALEKGREMGGFQLGSTVVLVFEAPETFQFMVEPGSTVKMGQALGEVGGKNRE